MGLSIVSNEVSSIGRMSSILARLVISSDIVERRDEAEDESGRVEPPAPFGKIAGEKDVIENDDEIARIGVTCGLRREARIVFEALLLHGAQKRRPLPLLVEQRQRQPASIAASIHIG